MKNIAIIGKSGSLAQGFINSDFAQKNNITSFGKNDYNFLNKTQVIQLAKKINNYDIIIICTGVLLSDPWDTYIINTVSIGLFLKTLTDNGSNARVIIAGSHGSMWTAWPNMPENRLWYNNSKRALYDIITSISHSKLSKLNITLVNFSKFESKMSGYSGTPISIIIDQLIQIINSNYPALIIELESTELDI